MIMLVLFLSLPLLAQLPAASHTLAMIRCLSTDTDSLPNREQFIIPVFRIKAKQLQGFTFYTAPELYLKLKTRSISPSLSILTPTRSEHREGIRAFQHSRTHSTGTMVRGL